MSESHDSVWAGRGRPPENRRSTKTSRRFLAAVAVAIVLIAGVTVAVAASLRDEKVRDDRTAAARQERLEAQERARLRRDGVPIRTDGPPRRTGEAPLAHRERLVTAGERAITADARARIERGELKSRAIQGTLCRTFPYTEGRAAQEADPSVPVNRYQCTAYTARFALPELEGKQRTGVIGQSYWLIADYRTARLTFCKIAPRPGEGGKALATVPVDPACRNPLA